MLQGHLSLVDPGYKAPCILCWMPRSVGDCLGEETGKGKASVNNSSGVENSYAKDVIDMHVKNLVLNGDLQSVIRDDVVEKKGFAVSVSELHSLEYRTSKYKEWGEVSLILSGGYLLDLAFQRGGIQSFLHSLGHYCTLSPIYVKCGKTASVGSGTTGL